jgi:uncharacterized protein
MTASPADIAVTFSQILRGVGVSVPTSCTHAYAEALCAIGLADRETTYWAGRATLIRQPEDIPLYDRAFAVFFEQRIGAAAPEEPSPPVSITIAVDSDDDEEHEPDASSPSDDVLELRFSTTETLRHKDFAGYTTEELVLAQQLMTRLRLVGAPRASLRMGPARSTTTRPDIRRTVRSTIRAGGEPIERHFLEPTPRLRRLVLLLDVSGSMEPYARALLRFVHAAVAGRQKVEAFTMGTRLTRVTRELTSRDPDIALRAAGQRVVDWSGGTRLGDDLREFNDQWGVRGLARNAVVVILSDGWDRGDPDELGEQMERLHRVTYRLIWVNPLKVSPGYAPLARGMAAALPHVDHFVEGHSVAALEELTALIAQR